jgi:hypothetical protein
MGQGMKLRISLVLTFLVGCVLMVLGEFAWRLDHGELIVAGFVLVAASIVAYTALVAASYPALLLRFSAAVSALTLAAAVALFLAGHPKYAVVFGFWMLCSVGAYFVCRAFIPRSAKRVKMVAGYCPACGGKLEPEDDECPWCRASFRSPSLPARESATSPERGITEPQIR